VLLVALSACGSDASGDGAVGEARGALQQEPAVAGSGAAVGIPTAASSTVSCRECGSREHCIGGDRRPCWHAALQVENADGDANSCSVGMDDGGNATAVWLQLTGSYDAVWANRHSAGAWQGAREVEGYSDRYATSPYVAVGADAHRALAVWTEPGGSLGSSVFDNTWQAAIVVRPSAGLAFSLGPVVAHPNGSVMAMTTTIHQGDFIESQLYANNAWGTKQAVPLGPAMGPSAANALSVALTSSTATSGSVDATAVWIQDDGVSGPMLVSDQFIASTGWETPTVIRPAGGAEFGAAKLSAAPYSRKTLAVWSEFRDSTSSTGTMVARTHDVTKGWGAQTKISDQVDANDSLQVATDDNGNVLAVWQRTDTRPASIWSMHFDVRSSKWSTPSQVDVSSSAEAAEPVLALEHRGGTAVVAWTVQGSAHHVWAARYAPQTGWSSPTLLSQDSARDATTPCVAISTNGDAIALWQESDGTRFNILSSSFE
jgi:hypothetical protein